MVPALLSTACILVLARAWASADELTEREMLSSRIAAAAQFFAFHQVLIEGQQPALANFRRHARDDIAKLTPAERELVPRLTDAIRDLCEHAIVNEGDRADAVTANHIVLAKPLASAGSMQRLPLYIEVVNDLFGIAIIERQMQLAQLHSAEGKKVLAAVDRSNSSDFVRKITAVVEKNQERESQTEMGDAINEHVGAVVPMVLSLRKLFDIATLCQHYVSTEQNVITELRFKQAHIQSMTLDIVYLGFAASIALAVFLLAAYGKFLNARLKGLLDFAGSMANDVHGSRPTQLAGSDEFAAMQHRLADVDQKLKELAAFRGFVTSMVAHDVRAPLMSAHLDLDVLKSDVAGTELAAEAAGAQEKIDSTVQFVEQLLTLAQNKEREEIGESQIVDVDAAASAIWQSKMFKKVLLLVCLPLIVQTAWLVWMAHLWDTKEQINREQRIVSAEILRGAELLNLCSIAVDGTVLWALSGKSKFRERAVEARSAFARLPLGDQGSLTRELAPTVQKLVALNLQTASFGSLPPAAEFDDITKSSIQSFQKWVPILRRQSDEGVELEFRYREFADKAQRLIWFALGVNILVYVGIWLYFSHKIRRRLDALLHNANSLLDTARGAEPVGGADELQELGGLIESARGRLQEATEKRSELVREIGDGIRRPLADVATSIDKLKSGVATTSDEVTRAALESAELSVREIVDLVDTLLTSEEIEQGRMQLNLTSCEIGELVDRAIDIVSPIARAKNITFNLKLPPQNISVDRKRMQQVLVNILDNALKYSPENGTITIGCTATTGRVTISIADEGPGMQPKTQLAGFGLGLRVCKMLVEMHGGSFDIESAPSRGMTCLVGLPAPH